MGTKISLCMMVKNEEQLIENGLKKARPYVDEIVVVDTGSSDKTIAIAEKYGAKIIHHPWDGYAGRARNAYLKVASGDWILVLDGDECIAVHDMIKIRNLVKNSAVSAYYFHWRDYHKNYNLLLNWHPNDGSYLQEEKLSGCPGWAGSKVVRFFRKSDVLSYNEDIKSAHMGFRYTIRREGLIVKNSNVVLHNFQYAKGGDPFIAEKQKSRLPVEIMHVKKYPDDFWISINVAKTLFNIGKDREAIQYLKRSLRVSESGDAHFVLGIVYKEQKKFKLAERHLQKAARLSETPADAWTVLGMIYSLQNKLSAARNVLQKALQIHPKHLLGINALGIMHKKKGFLKAAERCFKQAIEIHPEFGEAYFNLGLLYQAQRRTREAQLCFHHVLRLNPYDQETRNLLLR